MFSRPITSYSKVQSWISSLIRGNRLQLWRLCKREYLNVGCGANVDPRFTNVDYGWCPGVDLCWDIRNPLPFSDGSFNGLYTEHCLEHLDFSDALAFVRDAYRVITPGGTVRIVVPDGGLYLDLYAKATRGENVEFPYIGKEGAEDLKEDSQTGFTPMMAVNRIFRGYGHRFAYDSETLIKMLSHCGFRDVREAGFREGRDAGLLIDSHLRKPQSVYVEASR